ncbi:MAG: pantothenate kinase [Oscillospiraceae bacterium]
MVIGVDVGGSTTKLVACDEKDKTIGAYQIDSGKNQVESVSSALDAFFEKNRLSWTDVDKIILTGVGASYFSGNIHSVPTYKISEFEAIGFGGLAASGLDEALVVSMGTGTALVMSKGSMHRHIGGSGLGGGTLCGLGMMLLNESNVYAIADLAETGRLGGVDLMVRDICCRETDTLPLWLTASNFGKLDSMPTRGDIALGLINMVFQTICKVATFACQNTPIKDAVLTGTLAAIPQTGQIFRQLGEFYGMHFMIPENPAFATALGAIAAHKNEIKTVVY